MIRRPEGRAPHALRPVTLAAPFTCYAEGSVLMTIGQTQVVCTASVEERVPPHRKGSGGGWVTAEYGMLPRATHLRNEREAARGKQSGRTQEIQRLIGRSLRMAVDLDRLGERTIVIDCDVLQADGGTRCAAITGGWVALALACDRLVTSGVLTESPLVAQLAAVSVGVVGGAFLLDLDYEEDAQADFDSNVVMTADGRLVEIQGTAERMPIAAAYLPALVALAEQGITALVRLQQEARAAGQLR